MSSSSFIICHEHIGPHRLRSRGEVLRFRIVARRVLSMLLIIAGCGGASIPAPFTTVRLEAGHPLIEEVAECRGGETAVRDCVVDRICRYPFDAGEPRRFHLHPVGATPWIQVTLTADHRVSGIELARSGPDGSEYEVGFVCTPSPSVSAEDDELTLSLDEPGAPPDVLSLPEAQRTHEDARAAFDSAEDGGLVFQHALWLARSGDAADHALLEEALGKREVVELLGNTTIDRGPRLRIEPLGHRWPLAQILFALRDSERESAHTLLAHLAAAPLWSDESLDMPDSHVDWLVLALAAMRPPPAGVLAYWRAHARSGEGHVSLVFPALIENGSDAAMRFARALLRDRRFAYEDRAAWLRTEIAARRDRPEVVAVAEELLRLGLPPRLERRLVEDLFGDWTDELRPDTQLGCPALDRISPEAAAVLRRIGEHALARPVRAGTRAVVEEGLRLLGNGNGNGDGN
jgi:hypothetical protein